jgi:hypothetical protein
MRDLLRSFSDGYARSGSYLFGLYLVSRSKSYAEQGENRSRGHSIDGVEGIWLMQSQAMQRKYHAMIDEIANQAKHLGSQWESDDWKRLLLDKFARDTGRSHGKVITNLDLTGIVQIGLQSRKFENPDASEFIEWLLAWGVENGIRWPEWSERE